MAAALTARSCSNGEGSLGVWLSCFMSVLSGMRVQGWGKRTDGVGRGGVAEVVEVRGVGGGTFISMRWDRNFQVLVF